MFGIPLSSKEDKKTRKRWKKEGKHWIHKREKMHNKGHTKQAENIVKIIFFMWKSKKLLDGQNYQ